MILDFRFDNYSLEGCGADRCRRQSVCFRNESGATDPIAFSQLYTGEHSKDSYCADGINSIYRGGIWTSVSV